MSISRRLTDILSNPYVLILPASFIFFLIVIYPMVFTFYASLTRWGGVGSDMEFIGLHNYETLVNDWAVQASIINTLWLTLGASIIQVGFGLILALLLTQVNRGMKFFRTAFFMPSVMSMIAVGFLWNWIYHPVFGLFNLLLRTIGLGQYATSWLAFSSSALPAVLIAYSWQWIGFYMVIFLAGLQEIPPSFYESANLEGAKWYHKLFDITIPSIKHAMFVSLCICMVFTIKIFSLVYVMTGGGPGYSTEVIVLTTYRIAFRWFEYGRGSALSFILFAIVMVVSFLYIRILKRK